MTTRWSAVPSISLIRWLETNTVRPSAARSRSSSRIQRMPSGSRPLTGSSSIRTAGSPSSAAAMPSRCPMPSEKPRTRRRRPLQADQVEDLVDPRAREAVALREAQQVARRRSGRGAARAGRAARRRAASAGAAGGTAGRAPSRSRRGPVRPRTQRIVVDLPAPLGPRNPVTRPGSDGHGEVVDGDAGAVVLGEAVDLDHPSSMDSAAARPEEARPVGTPLAPPFTPFDRRGARCRPSGSATGPPKPLDPGAPMPPARQPDQSAPKTVSPTGVAYEGPKGGRDPRGQAGTRSPRRTACAFPTRPLAQGGCTWPDPPRGLPLPGEDHPLRPRADPGASRTRPRCRSAWRIPRQRRGSQVTRAAFWPRRAGDPSVHAFLHRGRLARLGGHRP